jgi:hypothetical protein
VRQRRKKSTTVSIVTRAARTVRNSVGGKKIWFLTEKTLKSKKNYTHFKQAYPETFGSFP